MFDTDEKLTDNEIIKGLECRASTGLRKINKCGKCKYVKNDLCNIRKLIMEALDLINRLQAEKEALINGQETLQKYIVEQKVENERLTTLAELGNMRANDYRVMRDRALKAEAENERLGITVNSYKKMYEDIQNLKMKVDEIKTEAYKEFAKNFVQKAEKTRIIYVADTTIQEQETGWYQISIADFDNLLKELVGEDNASTNK